MVSNKQILVIKALPHEANTENVNYNCTYNFVIEATFVNRLISCIRKCRLRILIYLRSLNLLNCFKKYFIFGN